jgi:uncharacterized membrane protein (UPF0127 family)
MQRWLVMIGNHGVLAEVVSTPETIQRGLMFRTQLAPDAGMLFVLPHESDHKFFMRNTLIPLDMIFIGRDLRVVGVVSNATPLTETLRGVGRPSSYVLEVNGGWAAKNGITVGAPVRFWR